jgi:chorismate mutase
LPIELKRRLPDLPMICDNSHICGNREDLAEVAQQALDLQYDGLMTEVHNDPDKAWSDAKQQVTPFRYGEIIQSLMVRRASTDDSVFWDNLEQIRHKIDEIDLEMLNLMARRMRLAEDIGRIKRKNNISILQTSRWNDILERGFQQGRERQLSDDFIEKLLNAVHQESITHQKLVMQPEGVSTR